MLGFYDGTPYYCLSLGRSWAAGKASTNADPTEQLWWEMMRDGSRWWWSAGCADEAFVFNMFLMNSGKTKEDSKKRYEKGGLEPSIWEPSTIASRQYVWIWYWRIQQYQDLCGFKGLICLHISKQRGHLYTCNSSLRASKLIFSCFDLVELACGSIHVRPSIIPRWNKLAIGEGAGRLAAAGASKCEGAELWVRAEVGIWRVWNPYCCGPFFFWEGGDHYRLWTPLFRGFGLKGTGFLEIEDPQGGRLGPSERVIAKVALYQTVPMMVYVVAGLLLLGSSMFQLVCRPCYHVGLSENRVYSQWNSHLIGIMISKTIGFTTTLFSDTPMLPCYHVPEILHTIFCWSLQNLQDELWKDSNPDGPSWLLSACRCWPHPPGLGTSRQMIIIC